MRLAKQSGVLLVFFGLAFAASSLTLDAVLAALPKSPDWQAAELQFVGARRRGAPERWWRLERQF
jgi:hypothetical protein